MALLLQTLSGTSKNITSELLLDTYQASGAKLVCVQPRLLATTLNGAAAVITFRLEHTTSADVVLASQADIISLSKQATSNTWFGCRILGPVYMANGDKLKLYATSTNASDTGASYTIDVLDADHAATDIGTPVALDSGTATVVGMLAKMADDNGGSSFDAGTDSLNKLSDALGSPMQAGEVTLAATQGSYAPAKAGDAMTLTGDYDAAKTAAQAGDEMDLVDAPNSTAVTAINAAVLKGGGTI